MGIDHPCYYLFNFTIHFKKQNKIFTNFQVPFVSLPHSILFHSLSEGIISIKFYYRLLFIYALNLFVLIPSMYLYCIMCNICIVQIQINIYNILFNLCIFFCNLLPCSALCSSFMLLHVVIYFNLQGGRVFHYLTF